jgi:hypothetical protein
MSQSEGLLARLLDRLLGNGNGRGGDARAAPLVSERDAPPREDEDEHQGLSDRERELELRILMSNWM